MTEAPHVETRGISKRFGGVQALSEVSVSIARGTVHALVGENGAGKSTLGKVISGDIAPDGGELHVDGSDVGVFLPDESSERLRGNALSGCGLVRMGVSALRKSV